MMELGQVGFWGTGLIGILAGFIAHRIVGGHGGIFWNLIVGIIGSYIGFFVAKSAGISLGEIFKGWFWGNLIVSAAGATVLLAALRMLRREPN